MKIRRIKAASSTVVNAYGFTGEQQFGEADELVFLRARYYKPSVGRFISRDPIGYEGGLNLYIYAENKPQNLIDPSGLMCCSECKDRYDKARANVLKEAAQCHNKCGPSSIGLSVGLCMMACAKTGAWFPVCTAACGGVSQIAWAHCHFTCGQISRMNEDAIRFAYNLCMRNCE